MVKIARSANLAGNTVRVISTLAAALELVEGVPGPDKRRFTWLDDEGIFHEIERQVVEAAHSLATLALANGTLALAEWSIKKGRIVSPDPEELDQDDRALG